MPGHFTFLLVDQMAVLLWDGLGAVLDLVDLTGPGGRVEHYHIEFPDGELQHEDFLLRVGQLGFQQNDVLHHPAPDLAENALRDEIAFFQGEIAEGFVQQQALDQGIGLGVAQTGLGDDRPYADVIHGGQASHLNVSGQIQKIQIFLDLSTVDILDLNGLLLPVTDLHEGSEPFGEGRNIDAVEDIRGMLPIPVQIPGGQPIVVGSEVTGKHLQSEAVGDILHNAIDGTGQLALLVQLCQMAEMPLIVIALQRMLDVPGDGAVHILVGTLLLAKVEVSL